MKSWIESAFSDEPSAATSSTRTTRTRKAATTTTAAATTKKPSSSSTTIKTSTKLPPLLSKIISNQENRSEQSKKPQTKCPLTVKYEPKKRTDLVVHKSKVEQLSTLIDQVTSKQTGTILTIEGPPGSGKNATLNVLCSEKSVDLMQWSQPSMSLNKIENNETDQDYKSDYQVYESQTKLFQQFLFKSSRYISDQIFTSEQRTKKLLHLKEIPCFAYRDIPSFQNQLRQFCKYSKYSLVICVTTSPAQSNELNPCRILTQDLRKELAINEITFNPIAASYMNKQIERIAELEQLTFIDSNSIAEICQSSDGDLRHAINTIELAAVKSRAPITTTVAKKRKTASKSSKENQNSEPSSALIQKKDANFSIFRGLGKVLHRKNDPDVLNIDVEDKLPKHLHSKYMRKPLLYQPEDIFNKLPISEELTTLYLHQNYLELYGIKSQSLDTESQLEALSRISDNFILSDLINCKLGLMEQSSSVYNTKYKELPALISIRSVLFYSYFTSEEKSSSKSLWMPLNKPYNYKCNELKRQRKQLAQRILFKDNNTQLASYLIEMQSEFFTTILPFANLKKMYRELNAKYTNVKQFKYRQVISGTTDENDPSLFMDDVVAEEDVRPQQVLASVDTNRKIYDYDDNVNIQILDF